MTATRAGGFTGTARGMSAGQRRAFTLWLIREHITELHVGDCVGADQQAADIARACRVRVVGHPPADPTWRAYWRHYAHCHAPRPFLDRDQDIVDAAAVLFGAPAGFREVLRSGTWATIRRGRKKDPAAVTVIAPDGSQIGK